jgi:hypothetical protein
MGKKEHARGGCRPLQPAHGGETASARDVTVLLCDVCLTRPWARQRRIIHSTEDLLRKVYERLADFVTQAGWVVFDVGANAGVYAVQQAAAGAHVYAFEPNPNCYRRLVKSVRLNNLESRVTSRQLRSRARSQGPQNWSFQRG